ncbi:helix-turn-helix transcriptional regulator [Sphingobium lactosutens]|uniref:helix-turn-helix transcriptional regulator n=1 Tax=Sphingobium lactosutens TaxID=522773 RepID=UPI0015B7A516|nr:helix-turn-helix transcriptional regulator [Sphingobium lactosutens]
MTDDDAFTGLLEHLYGGLTRSPPWEAFLQALASATDAAFATLIIGRGCAGIDAHVTPGANPDLTQEYREISEADPFVGLPEGQVVSFNDFVHHIPARFRHWMDVARTGQILGVDLHRPPDTAVRLRLTRDDSRADFGEDEKGLLVRLIPHLRIALDLHARLTTTQAESQLFSSAMADLAVATLILDRDGRIMRRNAVAARMLEDGAIIADRNGRLEPRTGAATATIARVLATPPPAGEESLFEIATTNGPALHGRARAVPSPAYGDGAWLALFLSDPSRPAGPSGESLRDRFQLTRAEAALAVQLLAGTALADAASALDIAYNTARSHLRAIFAKTGTHRQVQLVTLLRSLDSDLDN